MIKGAKNVIYPLQTQSSLNHQNLHLQSAFRRMARRDRLVVRTLRCGRSNPGSNPGLGTFFTLHYFISFFF